MLLYYATKDMMPSRTEKNSSRKKLVGKKNSRKKNKRANFFQESDDFGSRFYQFLKKSGLLE